MNINVLGNSCAGCQVSYEKHTAARPKVEAHPLLFRNQNQAGTARACREKEDHGDRDMGGGNPELTSRLSRNRPKPLW